MKSCIRHWATTTYYYAIMLMLATAKFVKFFPHKFPTADMYMVHWFYWLANYHVMMGVLI